jgi:hypothetical protein
MSCFFLFITERLQAMCQDLRRAAWKPKGRTLKGALIALLDKRAFEVVDGDWFSHLDKSFVDELHDAEKRQGNYDRKSVWGLLRAYKRLVCFMRFATKLVYNPDQTLTIATPLWPWSPQGSQNTIRAGKFGRVF